MHTRTFAGMIAVALALSTSVAGARTLTIDVKRADVQAYRPQSTRLGTYYALKLSTPARLPKETFMDAYLEVYVDATSDVDERATAGLVTFEVFPLKSALTGELSASSLRAAAMKRTVRVGTSRRVRINIAEYVRYVLDHPTENFGLVLGSLTGQRLGKFTLRQGVLGEGVVARVSLTFLKLGGPEAVRR